MCGCEATGAVSHAVHGMALMTDTGQYAKDMNLQTPLVRKNRSMPQLPLLLLCFACIIK
jgi:hypothetical protein